MIPNEQFPYSRMLIIDDFPYGWIDFGGPSDAKPLVFVHGTGLHAMTWLTHARELSKTYHCYAFDHRGHGDSTKERGDYDWGKMADDLAAFIRALKLDKPICVGHSMGGATVALAEGRHPGTIGPSILIDPIILPPNIYGVPVTYEKQPMAARTIRRRYEWDSCEQMIEVYSGKMPFKTWQPAELENYVRYGVETSPSGGVRLKCPPKIEADCYLGGHLTNPWPYLDGIRIPILLLRGTETDTARVVHFDKIAARLPDVRIEEIHGTHFLPMDNPEGVVRAVSEFASQH